MCRGKVCRGRGNTRPDLSEKFEIKREFFKKKERAHSSLRSNILLNYRADAIARSPRGSLEGLRPAVDWWTMIRFFVEQQCIELYEIFQSLRQYQMNIQIFVLHLAPLYFDNH